MSDDNFYRAFEEKHRGSRELIKSRQRVYLPFIEPLRSIYNDAKAIDLGCGRGEWLELLKESGFDAQGVDLDDGMLAACRELGLNVTTAEALATLKALPDASQLVVSGFHIAEHIPFTDLQILIQEALRVLKPAGLLILETPNPENITVGTVNFYIDPTHQKPIPSQLLSFLPEYYGFAKVKVIRLQEEKSLAGKAWILMSDVLGGVSPDYAILAQKSADESLVARTSDAFNREYGLSLNVLVERFDRQVIQANNHAAAAETRALQATDRAVLAESLAQQAIDRATSAETQALYAGERATEAESQAQQANAQAGHAATLLAAIHTSPSQRLADRAIKALCQWTNTAKRAVQTKTKLLLAHARLYVNRRPKVRHAALSVLASFPTLKARLKAAHVAQAVASTASIDLANLTPRARQIYADLKTAIDRQQKEGS